MHFSHTQWISTIFNTIFSNCSSYDEANDEDLLSQHLDGVLDDEDDQAELTDDSDECSI